MAANALSIRILEFYPKARERMEGVVVVGADGLPEMEDWVAYCPVGGADKLVVREAVKRILGIERNAPDNPAVQQSTLLADYIRPRYEAWKHSEELPDDGTPLAVASFLRREDIDGLKRAGVRTLEEFMALPDSARDAVKIPRARELQVQAKRFLEARNQNAAAAQLKAQEDTIARQGDELATLKAQMEALLASQAAPPVEAEAKRGRGRPPKQHEEAEAA